MTTTTTKQTPRLQPIYYEILGRSVPSTKKGTCRLFSLVDVNTLAQVEAWQTVRRTQNRAVTSGQVIDALTKFAVENGFKIS